MLTNFFHGEVQDDRYYPPCVLWSANRDKPVRENATLDFTTEGELILRDADGSDPVWSTKTSGHSVVRMEVTVGGNLMLLNGSGSVVWQSYDHPTNTWLPNQRIYNGHRLTAQNSSSNLSTGIYYLSVTKDGMHAFLDSNPPKQYALLFDHFSGVAGPDFGDFDNGNGIYSFETYFQFTFDLSTPEFRYVVLEPNGQLMLYRVEKGIGFSARPAVDVLSLFNDGCTYPTVCGPYGVCWAREQCTCPMEHNGNNSNDYFWPFEPNVGCAEITPLSCRDGSKSHTFVELSNFTYFDFVPMFSNTSLHNCKEACLNNCSCKAALFRYDEDVSSGNCSLELDEILYSFRKVDFNSYALIKVEKIPDPKKPASNLVQKVPDPKNPTSNLVLVLAPSLFSGLVFLLVGTCYGYRMLKNRDDAEEECDDQVSEALTKFSFEELKSSTQNFQIKLGQGGFGSVYEGVLCDGSGTKVAVKWLDSIGQGRKEFLAEVNTIGKVDHFNLVRLIGYYAEKLNRLLVYEYMCHGSLDQWIFNLDKAKTLGWVIRQKIIYGVAKGLEYLHEECNRKIIHFDIKPQNILLDGDFNAKISDFGLAKLIDRNQSLVLTVLRGTPGYLAPELFGGSNISVKADVYSFGIVILETVCGRKNLDSSESRRLINIVKTKAEEDQLYDLVNECNEDIWCHKEEAVKMIKIGLWCLQTHDRRPSISMVVKVLEGSTDMDQITDNHFLTMSHIDSPIQVNPNISVPPEASILSGPR